MGPNKCISESFRDAALLASLEQKNRQLQKWGKKATAKLDVRASPEVHSLPPRKLT
jgi:hypothetical protein